ncbi:hypothetical protein J8L98_13705 [Pseudoalteromonas sp. MMG013]|uniref:hypothetical protein n=1 Tax=Pseudoalteromonas sp. MMG013 TaxID=2822687 RepID=UPI001B380732|nr:hypothetical protein [Pseudoalteromonas sp. MMG013]MBQ4862747.1 hypothetical protein [Pseudoalteromonas sp. MMG013]
MGVIFRFTADLYKESALNSLLKDNTEEVERLKAEGKTPEQIFQHFSSDAVSSELAKKVDLLIASGVDYARLSGALAAFATGGGC